MAATAKPGSPVALLGLHGSALAGHGRAWPSSAPALLQT